MYILHTNLQVAHHSLFHASLSVCVARVQKSGVCRGWSRSRRVHSHWNSRQHIDSLHVLARIAPRNVARPEVSGERQPETAMGNAPVSTSATYHSLPIVLFDCGSVGGIGEVDGEGVLQVGSTGPQNAKDSLFRAHTCNGAPVCSNSSLVDRVYTALILSIRVFLLI